MARAALASDSRSGSPGKKRHNPSGMSVASMDLCSRRHGPPMVARGRARQEPGVGRVGRLAKSHSLLFLDEQRLDCMAEDTPGPRLQSWACEGARHQWTSWPQGCEGMGLLALVASKRQFQDQCPRSSRHRGSWLRCNCCGPAQRCWLRRARRKQCLPWVRLRHHSRQLGSR